MMDMRNFDHRLRVAIATAALACILFQGLLLLPPSAYSPGTALLAAATPSAASPNDIRRNAEGELVLIAGGKLAPSLALKGWIDHIAVRGNRIVVTGWAADTVVGQPATRVLIFSTDMPLAELRPNLPRPDVAQSLQLKDAINFGFEAVLPEGVPPETLTAYALSHDGKATALAINPFAHSTP